MTEECTGTTAGLREVRHNEFMEKAAEWLSQSDLCIVLGGSALASQTVQQLLTENRGGKLVLIGGECDIREEGGLDFDLVISNDEAGGSTIEKTMKLLMYKLGISFVQANRISQQLTITACPQKHGSDLLLNFEGLVPKEPIYEPIQWLEVHTNDIPSVIHKHTKEPATSPFPRQMF